jgi:transcription initiation factor TFIIIB Brf1 subunit/transcription initiation factor TFIIB
VVLSIVTLIIIDMSGGTPKNQRSTDNHLEKASSNIETVASELGCSSRIVDLAETLYPQILDGRNKQIQKIEPAALAVLYLAAKIQEEPIDPEEIASINSVSTSKDIILRRARDFTNLLSLDLKPFFDANPYINRFCEDLNLGEEIKERSFEIINYCSKKGLTSGKEPSAMAAGAIYLAGIELDENITQEEIGDVANISTVTIRNRYQEQQKAIREIESIPSEPHSTIDWYANRMNLPKHIEQRAHQILSRSNKEVNEIDEPLKWAAAAIKLAGEENDCSIGGMALKEPMSSNPGSILSIKGELKRSI